MNFSSLRLQFEPFWDDSIHSIIFENYCAIRINIVHIFIMITIV